MSAGEGGGREGDQGGLPSPSCARRGGRKGGEGILINLFLMHHLVPVSRRCCTMTLARWRTTMSRLH